jgi:molybdenum cofactor cytidylyltransferase
MSFAGVVPAAGSSRRMGRPKALLRIEGETFVRRVVRALREGGCDPVYVIGTEGDAGAAEEAAAAGGTLLPNPAPGEGPITSLRIALGELDDSCAGVVYLPLDHPMVPAALIMELLEAARERDAVLTLPVFGDERGHPAVFGRALFPELLDPALQGGARTVVHRHLDAARLVPTTERGVVTDVDTPSAYADALDLSRERET